MSFVHPLWLIALVAVPLAWFGAIRYAHATRKAAHAYADPMLLDVSPTRRVRSLRLAAIITALTAIAAGPIALAKPIRDTDAKERRGSVMLLIDRSKSMTKTDLAPTRLDAARAAANQFLDVAPPATAVGLVTFAGSASVVVAPTTDRGAVRRALANMPIEEGTAIGNAIGAGLAGLRIGGALATIPTTPAASAGRMLLLTDGDDSTIEGTTGAVGQARAARVPVYTVLLGNDPPRPGRAAPGEQLASVATQTGGIFTQSVTTEDLSRVFSDLGSSLARVRRVEDLSVWAIVGALALLGLAGVLGALSWWNATRGFQGHPASA